MFDSNPITEINNSLVSRGHKPLTDDEVEKVLEQFPKLCNNKTPTKDQK